MALLDSIYLIGPEDSDVDFLMGAVALFGGPTGDDPVDVETTVIIDAVVDMPIIPEVEAANELDDIRPPTNIPESGSDEPEASTFDVSIAAIFDDVTDGSEHHMLFARVPDGWTTVAGSDGYQGAFEVTTESFIYLGVSYPKTLAGLTDLLIEAGFETTDLSGLLAADGSAADGQLINLAVGENYAMFYLTADEMVSNDDSPTSPSYTANVTLTLQAPDRWDMEEGEGWQVVGNEIGFVPEDTDGDGEADSGTMIDDSGVVEFNIPTYALAMDIPTETDTELTYENNLSLVEAGTVEVTVDPVHGQLYVDDSAGFEDGDSGDAVGVEVPGQDAVELVDEAYIGFENDTGIAEGPIALNISFAVPDNEWLTQLEITGVRADAAVVSESGNVTLTNNGSGSWTATAVGNTLTQDDLNDLSIQLNYMSEVETDDDTDMDLDVTATFYDPDTGHSLVRGGEINVVVDAVAEEALILPPIEEDFSYDYNEDNAAAVGYGGDYGGDYGGGYGDLLDNEPIFDTGFSAATTDIDGSESITRIVLDLQGERGFAASDDPTAINVMLDGQMVTEGATIKVRGEFVDSPPAHVDALAGFDADGNLILTFDSADEIQRVDLTGGWVGQVRLPDVTEIGPDENGLPPGNYAGLQVRLPQHSDQDLDIEASVFTREAETDMAHEITLDNNLAMSTVMLHLEVKAVADGAGIDTDDQDTRHYEDGSNRVSDQGDEAAPGLFVALDFEAQLVDQDSSEAVSQILVSLEGADQGARFVAESGDLGSEITLSGVRYSVSNSGHLLTLSLVEDPANVALALGANIDINGAVRVELPVDDSTDFATRITVTTGELGAEGAPLPGYDYHTTETLIQHEVLGVVGKAATELDGARYDDNETVIGLKSYDAETNTLSFYEDGISSSEGQGDEAHGLFIPILYSATTQDDDGSQQSEGVRRIDLNMGDSDGTWQILNQEYDAYISGLTANGKGGMT